MSAEHEEVLTASNLALAISKVSQAVMWRTQSTPKGHFSSATKVQLEDCSWKLPMQTPLVAAEVRSGIGLAQLDPA